ncbi:MAG: gluconokinase [Actinomycetes bacterium]
MPHQPTPSKVRVSEPYVVVVMGVSGTGKSSVGARTAASLDVDFVEGDAHHPPANIEKMRSGVPLTDEDRMPWLTALAGLVGARVAEGRSVVLTCSALRRAYRDVLGSRVPDGSLLFVHLTAPFPVLERRMAARPEHFMPVTLLRSQLDTLEPLDDDERGVVIDVTPDLDEVVPRVLDALRSAVARA